jgi:hypothetical protein
MKKSKLIKVFRSVVDLFTESDHIDEDFARFLEQCLEDYLWTPKKLDYSLTSMFEHRDYVDEKTQKEIYEILKRKLTAEKKDE